MMSQKIEQFLVRYGWVTLLVLSLITHFIFFGYPREVVFDEVHFGKFASAYFTGNFFFDIHPPLAKLLITLFGWIGGYQPGFSFVSIGQNFPDSSFLWLRLLPTLAGVALPLILCFLCIRLRFSRMAAFSVGLLVILENSLLVQSRFILLDSLLLLFGFGGMLLACIARAKRSTLLYLLSGLSLACAFSIKWTGLSFLCIVGAWELWISIQNKISWKEWLMKFCAFCIVPVLFYLAIFQIHFSLLYKSGTGDAFMSQEFQAHLVGSPTYSPEASAPGFFSDFTELNTVMYTANSSLLSHPYGSKWWTWPLMLRPIYYWNKVMPKVGEAKIYLIGNPLIYWAGFVAVCMLLFRFLFRWKKHKEKREIITLLLASYFFNLLAFIFIGRVMFLYHYFTSLIFSIMILAFVIDSIDNEERKRKFFLVFIIVSLVLFLFFAPLTYGLPLSVHAQAWRFWLPTWR